MVCAQEHACHTTGTAEVGLCSRHTSGHLKHWSTWKITLASLCNLVFSAQSPKNMLIFKSKWETGKVKLFPRPDTAAQVFVAHDKILDDRLGGKECASVPNNMLCSALFSPFYVPRLTSLVSLDKSCRQPQLEEVSYNHTWSYDLLHLKEFGLSGAS